MRAPVLRALYPFEVTSLDTFYPRFRGRYAPQAGHFFVLDLEQPQAVAVTAFLREP